MTCAEKDALSQAYRAAVTQYRATVKDGKLLGAKRYEKVDDAHGDCERRRGALRVHCEKHGC